MIKGISEVRRLPRLGVIRLGEKVVAQSGKSYPRALDYFNLKDAPDVAKAFGEKPRELEVMIPHEDPAVFFSQYRKAYRTSGLFCKGDGEKANRIRLGISDGVKTRVPAGQPWDPDGEKFLKDNNLGGSVKIGARFELPCLGEICPFTLQKLCRPLGQLLVLIPKAQGFGCYQISTTSFNSMVDLNSYIEAVRAAAGRVSMIPLVLKLVPKKVTVEGKAKTILHMKLEYRGTVAELVKYRDAKYISADILPAIEHEIPDDLYPHAGADLDKHLDGAPVEEVPAGEIIEEQVFDAQEPVEEPLPPGKPAARPAPAPTNRPPIKGRLI